MDKPQDESNMKVMDFLLITDADSGEELIKQRGNTKSTETTEDE